MSSNKKQIKVNSLSDLAAATGMKTSPTDTVTQSPRKIIILKQHQPTLNPNTSDSNNLPNIGWLFYKSYFKKAKFDYVTGNKTLEDLNPNIIKKKNLEIINSKWVEIDDKLPIGQTIDLKVTYPGLITGIGISHEAGIEGELKLGLHFDYAYGQPIIHGSSVKGLLRSVFPNGPHDKHAEAKFDFLKETLGDKLKSEGEKKYIRDLENEIFEGIKPDKSQIGIYHRDIFFDAILGNANKGRRILETDSITPHNKNPLKNPIPLPFLKINSGCTIQFRFDLKPGILDVSTKITLFTEILKTLGIGAKTNVGYGQFDEQ